MNVNLAKIENAKSSHYLSKLSLACLLCVMIVLIAGCRVFGAPAAVPPAPTATLPSEAEVAPTASWTPTPLPTDTPLPTATPTSTLTDTPTVAPPTATSLVTAPETAVVAQVTVAATATATGVPTEAIATAVPPPATVPVDGPTAVAPSPTLPCVITPQWGFGDVWSNPEVKERLGCAVNGQVGVQAEEIYFQYGHMLYRPDEGLIYVLQAPYMENGWGAFVDTYEEGEALFLDADLAPPTPRVGEAQLYQPTGRFAKLWLENPWMKERLGWAIRIPGTEGDELVRTFSGAVQDFERGVLFWNRNVCFVLYTDKMSWTIY